jgi:hypothetical protein
MLSTAADNAMTKVENRSGLEDYFIATLEGLSLTNYHFRSILSFVHLYKLSFWRHSLTNCHFGNNIYFMPLHKLPFWKKYLSCVH